MKVFHFYFVTLQPQTIGRDGGMVDTRDLKSLDPKRLCGFESRSRHRLSKTRNDAKGSKDQRHRLSKTRNEG